MKRASKTNSSKVAMRVALLGFVVGGVMWFAPGTLVAVIDDSSYICNGSDTTGGWYPELNSQAFDAGFTEESPVVRPSGVGA
jgi:hypothetical protein